MSHFFTLGAYLFQQLRDHFSWETKLTDVIVIALIYMQVRIYRRQAKIMEQQRRVLNWQYSASIRDVVDKNRPTVTASLILKIGNPSIISSAPRHIWLKITMRNSGRLSCKVSDVTHSLFFDRPLDAPTTRSGVVLEPWPHYYTTWFPRDGKTPIWQTIFNVFVVDSQYLVRNEMKRSKAFRKAILPGEVRSYDHHFSVFVDRDDLILVENKEVSIYVNITFNYNQTTFPDTSDVNVYREVCLFRYDPETRNFLAMDALPSGMGSPF
jgi:hypothetical protein